MRHATKCLKLEQGLIYFVAGEDAEQFSRKEIGVNVLKDIGVVVQAGDILLPVLDEALEHLIQAPIIMISFMSEGRFVEDRASYLQIDKEALLEAKGAWGYIQSATGH